MALQRKRRRCVPRGWSEGLDDLHDYYQTAPTRRTIRLPITEEEPIIVTDDWPERVPISDAELRVIESHLRKELDELLGPLP